MLRKTTLMVVFAALVSVVFPTKALNPNERIWMPAETFTVRWEKDGLVIECYTVGHGVAGSDYTMSVKALEPYGKAGGDLQLFYAENGHFFFFPDPYGGETVVSPLFMEFTSYKSDFYLNAVERGGFWVEAKLLKGQEGESVSGSLLFVVVNP